jgi:hypothetical protein
MNCKAIVVLMIILISFFTIFSITNRPSEEVLAHIVIENGIKIDGSDSNMIPINNHEKINSISISLVDEEIQQLQIIDSGYDILGRKFFAIVKIYSYSDTYTLNAKVMMLLHYNNGWELSNEIGILRADFIVDEP